MGNSTLWTTLNQQRGSPDKNAAEMEKPYEIYADERQGGSWKSNPTNMSCHRHPVWNVKRRGKEKEEHRR